MNLIEMLEEKQLPEEWLPMIDYEGLYKISSLGRVMRAVDGPGTYAGKILRPGTDKGGYQYVHLCKNEGNRTDRVHRLVTAAFVGPCPEGKQVNHKDGDKTNNKIENLEYITPSENMLHALDIGLNTNWGERSVNTNLTNEDVYEIRRLADGEESQESIGKRFNLAQVSISRIMSRKRWGRLPEESNAQEENTSE